jgi:hypothetical protein
MKYVARIRALTTTTAVNTNWRVAFAPGPGSSLLAIVK